MAVSANFHEYFHQNDNKIPPSAHDNPYTFHFQTGGVPIFEWMARYPARIASFNMAMTTASTQGTASITLFPWRKAITAPTTAETPLVVDVGGGRGHAAQVIREQIEGVLGRVIVQDLAGTIEEARNEHPDVEKMAHNFFDPQPVKGTIRAPLLIISPPPRSSINAHASLPSLGRCLGSFHLLSVSSFSRCPRLLYPPGPPRLDR